MSTQIQPTQPDLVELPSTKQAAFRKIKMSHRRVIFLHLTGASNEDIARTLGASSSWVGNVLRNPAVAPILDTLYSDYDIELRGMGGLAVENMRRGMEDTDPKVYLPATDMYHKRMGAYTKAEKVNETAESVIERVLAVVTKDGTRIKYGERRLLNRGGQDGSSNGDTPLGGGDEVVDV